MTRMSFPPDDLDLLDFPVDSAPVPQVSVTIHPTLPKSPLHEMALSVLKSPGADEQPTFVQDTVWEIAQEYIARGGLFDLTTEIERLVELEQRVDVNATKDYRLSEKVRAIQALVEARARLKVQQMQLLERRRNYLTFDIFGMFLEGLGDILTQQIHDPLVVQRIGVELGKLTSQIVKKMGAEG